MKSYWNHDGLQERRDYPRTFARDLPRWHGGIEEKLEVLINVRINDAWDESIANGYIKDSEQWIG